jgi:hypothetical protein
MIAALTHKLYELNGDVVHAADDPRDVLALFDRTNPLADDWKIPTQVAANQRLITWSGTLATGDDLFASHPLNWLAAGRTALDSFCEQILPTLKGHHQQIAFRPHARHILSDAPSTQDFLNKHPAEPFELALDPAAMIESTMQATIVDHLERIFETLGGRAAMIILSRPDLQSDVMQRLITQHVPLSTPIVINTEIDAPILFPA